MLVRAVAAPVIWPQPTTRAAPWFNPHQQYTAMATKTGSGNQLTADGAAQAVQFERTDRVWGIWAHRGGQPMAVNQKVGPTSTTTDGPYFIFQQ
jgi:hypothetical protein